MRPETLANRRRLYLLGRVIVARHYRGDLTLSSVAAALSCSSRQLQRAYAQFGDSFRADLTARRMAVAAELLREQHAIPVASVARLVGYRQRSHFAQAFRACFGVTPLSFREQPPGAAGGRYRGSGRVEAARPALTGSPIASSVSASSAGSALGRRRRISVPPPGGDSAAIVPPC